MSISAEVREESGRLQRKTVIQKLIYHYISNIRTNERIIVLIVESKAGLPNCRINIYSLSWSRDRSQPSSQSIATSNKEIATRLGRKLKKNYYFVCVQKYQPLKKSLRIMVKKIVCYICMKKCVYIITVHMYLHKELNL